MDFSLISRKGESDCTFIIRRDRGEKDEWG